MNYFLSIKFFEYKKIIYCLFHKIFKKKSNFFYNELIHFLLFFKFLFLLVFQALKLIFLKLILILKKTFIILLIFNNFLAIFLKILFIYITFFNNYYIIKNKTIILKIIIIFLKAKYQKEIQELLNNKNILY